MTGAAEHMQVVVLTSLVVPVCPHLGVVNTFPRFLECYLLTWIVLVGSQWMIPADGSTSSV